MQACAGMPADGRRLANFGIDECLSYKQCALSIMLVTRCALCCRRAYNAAQSAPEMSASSSGVVAEQGEVTSAQLQ